MNICVIHLSDLHIRYPEDFVLQKARDIASCAFEQFRESSHCLIAITGDIAFSGQAEEYKLATDFLGTIKETLSKESNTPIDFVIVPGNHDCKLIPENSIRSTIIESVLANQDKSYDTEIVGLCTQAQEEFFAFEEALSPKTPIYSDKLWKEIEINVGGKKIRLSLINASWMSTIHEEPGKLVYPINNYAETLRQDCDFRFSFVHHPLNWYCQQTYHEFRRSILASSSIVFSGHEHVNTISSVSSLDSNNTIFIESNSLQPHSTEGSGFSVVSVDIAETKVCQRSYTLTDDKYVLEPQKDHSLEICTIGEDDCLTKEFVKTLQDPGAALVHPDKAEIDFSDIYVSPELESKNGSGNTTLDELSLIENKIIIFGDEQSGKTKILHHSFMRLYGTGIYPVYLDAKTIKRNTRNGIKKAIAKAVELEYINPEIIERSEKSKRVLLLDSYEEIGKQSKGVSNIFEYIEENFGTVLIACDNVLNSGLTTSGEHNDKTIEYTKYSIKDFGFNLRYQLIKKWHSNTDRQTPKELEVACHNTESVITTVLGKNLVPSRPLFLLVLMQSSSYVGSEELHNSGTSYYYQYLITKNLDESGIGRDIFDELFTYLAHLAWFYRSLGREYLEKSEIQKFNDEFSKKYTTVNLDKQLRILTKSKILNFDGMCYGFSYPYIKYFFIGKFFADNIDDQEIINIIENACENLSTRENSNLILFLTHHKNSSWVVDSVSKNLGQCFAQHPPILFESDSAYLNDLIGAVSEIVISDLNVEESQEHKRKVAEEVEYEPSEAELEKGHDDYQEPLADLFKLIRSTEVLGQILKNYYGSITRDKKHLYLKEAIEAPLRLLAYILDTVLESPDDLTKGVEAEIARKNKEMSESEVKRISAGFVSEMIRGICTGVVSKAAESIGSEKLKEDIDITVSEEGSNAYKLIQAAIYLIAPNKLPVDKIRALARELEGNGIAYAILQGLVHYHIHMFHTTDAERQQLGAALKINLRPANVPRLI